MHTDYMDALDYLDELCPTPLDDIDADYRSVDPFDNRQIYEFVHKWFEPAIPRMTVRCALSIHEYKGYRNDIMTMGAGRILRVVGVCVRCGKYIDRHDG
jgi:argonaute-like protein implicated in RNA metabolism and viral defense